MKRFSLFFCAAVAALCGFAQSVGEHGELIGQYGAIYQMAEDAPASHIYDCMGYKAVYDAGDEEQGTEAGVYILDVARKMEVVEFEDGTMFFKDLVTDYQKGSYVKGQRIGDEIRIPVGQILAHSTSYDCNIILSLNVFDSLSGEIEESDKDIVFKVERIGDFEKLTQESDYFDWNFYGAVYEDDRRFAAIGDAAMVMTYNYNQGDNDALVEIPAGLETKTYNCHAYSYMYSAQNNYKDTYVDFDVKVAIDGSDFYIQGLYYFQREDAINQISNVIKGTIEDGIVTLPQHQLLGYDGRGALIYAVACAYGVDEDGDETLVDAPSVTLIYDEDEDTYDGGMSVIRFAPTPFYTYANSYESIDEIFLSPKDTEGINTVLAPAAKDSKYDLQGRKINAAAKGLYIQNGRKTIR